MIDLDDVDSGFWYGGLFFGVIFLVIYLIWSRPEIKKCEQPTPEHPQGGVIVKSNGDTVCIDKSALINPKPAAGK